MAAAAQAPQQKRRVRSTSVLLGVVAGVGFGLVALGAWHLREEGATIRGSIPPDGMTMPRVIDDVSDEITPPLPMRSEMVAEAPQVLLLTCADCPSGEVVGSLLQRADISGLPEQSRIHVVLLGASARAAQDWRAAYGIRKDADHISVHAAPKRASRQLSQAFRIGDSGTAFLFDEDQVWRATYHLGQLDFADVVHDARAVS